MACTTSASARVRPTLLGSAGPWMKYAALCWRTLLRLPQYCHPSLALALLLATLGLLSPFLPYGLLSALLLIAGAALVVLTKVDKRTAPRHNDQKPSTKPQPYCVTSQTEEARATFYAHEIVLERRAQRVAEVVSAASPSHNGDEEQDKNWAELMARVNHELRTPLNAVIGFSDLMALKLFGPVGDPRYEDYIQHIRDSANELLKSAEDTMALTALVADPRSCDGAQTSDLQELTLEAWSFLSAKAATCGLEIELCIASDLEVQGEPRALRQILVNILSEGVSRADDNSKIKISASVEEELVQLYFSVSKERSNSARDGNSLAICLARALLEMQGSSLLEVKCPVRGWGAVTVLDRAAQPDFFMDGEIATAHAAAPALAS